MLFQILVMRRLFRPAPCLDASLSAFLVWIVVRIRRFADRGSRLPSKTGRPRIPRRKPFHLSDLLLSVLGRPAVGESVCVNAGPNPKTLLPVPRSNSLGRFLLSLFLRTPKSHIRSNFSRKGNLVGSLRSTSGFCRRDKGGGLCYESFSWIQLKLYLINTLWPDRERPSPRSVQFGHLSSFIRMREVGLPKFGEPILLGKLFQGKSLFPRPFQG